MSTIVLPSVNSEPLKHSCATSPLKRPIDASPLKNKNDSSPPKRPQYDRFILKFKKLTQEATRPTKASEHAAGYDLHSAYDTLVPAKGKALVKTDLQLQIPVGCYGRVAPRSGLALKHSIDVGAGVIDADYRGNVGVILFNFGESDFQVKKGDRIAQLICEKIAYPELEEADENEELEATNRGANGFGSSGMN